MLYYINIEIHLNAIRSRSDSISHCITHTVYYTVYLNLILSENLLDVECTEHLIELLQKTIQYLLSISIK